jgi:hypothetical protein
MVTFIRLKFHLKKITFSSLPVQFQNGTLIIICKLLHISQSFLRTFASASYLKKTAGLTIISLGY